MSSSSDLQIPIVINTTYGGFSLSHEAMLHYLAQKIERDHPKHQVLWVKTSSLYSSYYIVPAGFPYAGKHTEHHAERDAAIEAGLRSGVVLYINDRDIPRHDPLLIHTIRTLGEEASSGECAQLEIRTIIFDTKNVIKVHDGKEHITMQHW